MPLTTGTKLGNFEILSAIGAGGMGEVYKAVDMRLKRAVALKVLPSALALDADRMARFEREARLLASLDHANIGTIHGIEESDGTKALVLALIDGPTLAERIAAGAIPIEEAIPLARQIAEAIEYAHERGVIHRDLKPANVKITPESVVKVLDFGLSRALTGEGDEGLLAQAISPTSSPTISIGATRAGMILGTPAYMAPEQAHGKTVDRRADIWAFGVLFFEMLTGATPFHGETAAEVIASSLKDEPNLDLLPRGTPKAIRRLIRRCLEKDPKRRLQAIGEARILLAEPMEENPADDAPAAGPVRVSSKHGWGAWATAGVLFAIAAATLFVHLREGVPAAVTPARFPLFQDGNRFTLSGWEFSRDGRAVAYASNEGGQFHIWIRLLDSLQPRQLAGTEGASYPFWSPDGEHLGFFAEGKLKRVALAGGPPQVLCDAPTGRGGSWNREGTIVFSPSIGGGIFQVPANGGTPNEVVKNGRFPEFIEGGKHFFFLSNDGTNHAGVSVGSLDGSAPREVLQDPSRAIYVPPPAGERVGHVLYRRGAALMAQRFDPDRLTVDGNAVPLAERVPPSGNIGYGGFAASETGVLLIVAEDAVETRTVTWLDRSGQETAAKGETGTYVGFSLSPDGKRLATVLSASADTSAGSDIWLRDVDSDSPARFTFGGNMRLPTWSPRGDFLVFGTRQQIGR